MSKKRIPIVDAFQLNLFDYFDEVNVEVEEIPSVDETEKFVEILEDNTPFVFEYGSKANVWKQYPWLREHQAEDASKIEKRLYIENEKGIQITNGTGVGKTFLGLSVANRAYYNGKQNILIVTPSDKKVKDWIKDNKKKFETDLRAIKSVTSIPLMENNQPGMVVTTFSTFYQNELLKDYTWDLIIYDESHKLMENGLRKDTVYLQMHRQIGGFPNHFKNTVVRDNLDLFRQMSPESRAKRLRDYTDRTKILFLSASPFAYHGSLIIGDGSLWNINENYRMETINDLMNIYDDGRSPYDKFFIKHFGYRVTNNKLTKPEYGVDIPFMERKFFDDHVKLGAISGRKIEVEKDYSREFIILDSEIGRKIDEGFSILESNDFKKNYKELGKIIPYHLTWLYKNQLLESIKSKLIIPRMKKHLALGRKIVIFHDYNNSEPDHPFRFNVHKYKFPADFYFNHTILREDLNRFKEEYKHLWNLDISDDLSSVPDEITKHFGQRARLFNGTIGNAKRSRFKDDFQDDLSGVDIICVQRQAGKEGIDLHDVTGVYQRVLMDVGLPRRPTDSIQCEGRIYRDGLMSNAIWEYMIINTIFERTTFADAISERASTAENLAMGSLARNLKYAFKQGYEEAQDTEPSLDQGTGGKEYDIAANDKSDFEIAVALYYSNERKTAKNKSSEGKDYFATPEPLGYKIVQWLDIRPNETVLEPSAGHGAIARFFPGYSDNRAIEPSFELMSKLKLNCDNIKKENYVLDVFENHSKMNKYNKVAMNPPFGVGAKDAIMHLEKVLLDHIYNHTNRTNSRVICIVPDSPNVDKFLTKISSEDYYTSLNKYDNYRSKKMNVFANVKHSATIYLPSCTFNRAGTSVMCRVLVFDVLNDYNINKSYIEYDFTHITKVEDFFNEIENLHIPTYIPNREDDGYDDDY